MALIYVSAFVCVVSDSGCTLSVRVSVGSCPCWRVRGPCVHFGVRTLCVCGWLVVLSYCALLYVVFLCCVVLCCAALCHFVSIVRTYSVALTHAAWLCGQSQLYEVCACVFVVCVCVCCVTSCRLYSVVLNCALW